MPPVPTALTAAGVKNAKTGRYGDGNGLYLLVRPNGTRFWIFRYTRDGKMREMGLGRAGADLAAVPLAEARQNAASLFRMVRGGLDPLAQREAEAVAAKAAVQEAAARAISFRAVTGFYLAAHAASWSNPKHRAQWTSTLDTYANPVMGDMPVAAVGTAHVLSVLQPVWHAKPETASRLRGRIEAVLDYAKVREWRTGENPARWRGHLDHLLPARSKVAAVEHHAALPWRNVGEFMVELRSQAGIGARALEFAILTAARTGEVLGMTWGEVDMRAAVWTVPGSRMKAGKEHRVPLPAPALAVLTDMARLRTTDDPHVVVFPGAQAGRPLSNMALLMALRRMGRGDLTTHGFRSTFRDWTAETTAYPREVAEAALAHTLGDKVEAAYRRGDLFEKRRRLMGDWAGYCVGPGADRGGIVPIRAQGSAA